MRIITSTSSSASQRVIAAGSALRTSRFSALRCSGRLSVIDRDPIGDVDEHDVCSVTSARVSPEVERDLDRAGLVLGGERGERVAPVVERGTCA